MAWALSWSVARGRGGGWHAPFRVAAGLGVVFCVLILTIVPESRIRVPGRVDVIGVIGLGVGLGAFLLDISKGGDWGWAGSSTLTSFAVAVIVLGAWGWWELRVPSPIVDLRTSARRPVLATNLASVGVGLDVVAFAYAATPNLIMRSVPADETAAANGLNALSRSLGTSTASAIIGVVLGQLTVSIHGVALPSETGVRVTLAIGVAAAALAAAPGSLIPATRDQHTAAPATAAD